MVPAEALLLAAFVLDLLAGALGVTFGGARSYGGELHNAPLLGIRAGECSPLTIRQSVMLMRLTAVLFLVFGVGGRIIVQFAL